MTAAGRARLGEWLPDARPLAPEERDLLLLKVFFAELAEPGSIIAQLDGYAAVVRERLVTYEAIERELLARPGTPGQLAAVRLGVALMRATLTWARQTRVQLLDAATAEG